TGGEARRGRCLRAEVGVPGAQPLDGPVGVLEPQRVRLLLPPFERAAVAVDAQHEAVLLADADLAREQHAVRIVVEARPRRAVAAGRTAGPGPGQVTADRRDLEPRHVLGGVGRVHADVAEAAARPRLRGIEAPAGLLVPFALERRREPALRVLDDDLADLAERTGGDARGRFAHHRIGGVDVRQCIEPAARANLVAQPLALVEA